MHLEGFLRMPFKVNKRKYCCFVNNSRIHLTESRYYIIFNILRYYCSFFFCKTKFSVALFLCFSFNPLVVLQQTFNICFHKVQCKWGEFHVNTSRDVADSFNVQSSHRAGSLDWNKLRLHKQEAYARRFTWAVASHVVSEFFGEMKILLLFCLVVIKITSYKGTAGQFWNPGVTSSRSDVWSILLESSSTRRLIWGVSEQTARGSAEELTADLH